MKKLCLAFVTLVLSLVLAEVALRSFSHFPVHGPHTNQIPDPLLKYRLDSSLRDIDSKGFRNPQVLESVDIVAIGDSHTYGQNVSSEEAWPAVLAEKTQQSVYNYGIPGYGFLHYQHLMTEALSLKPKTIIWGLYLPNDIDDVCKLIKAIPQWAAWAEQRGYETEACIKLTRPLNPRLSKMRTKLKDIKKLALGSLASTVRQNLSAYFRNETMHWFDHPMNPTGMSPLGLDFQSNSLNLSREGIDTACLIAKETLREAKALCDQNQVKFVVALFPSKDRVYYPYLLESSARIPQKLHRLVEHEKVVNTQIIALCKELEIPIIDSQPHLSEALEKVPNVYPKFVDSHPLEKGYEVYAEAIYQLLSER